jgi:hypothetical protein
MEARVRLELTVGVLYLLAQKPGNTDRWLHDPIREIDHWFHGIRSFFLDFQIPIIVFFLDFQTPIIGFIASIEPCGNLSRTKL